MSDSRYQARGVSAGKEDVHQAIQNIDKGLFPKAFCKIVPDYLTHDEDYCIAMHADGAGTKSSLAYMYWKETGDISVWQGIAEDAIVMNLDDLLCVGITNQFLFSSTIDRNKHRIPGTVLSEIIEGSRRFFTRMQEQGVNIEYLGGETADVGDLVRTIAVNGTLTARWPKNRIISNERIKAGDVIVGLASFGQSIYEDRYNSGIASNGLTSARHDLLANQYAHDYPETFESTMDRSVVYTGPYRLTDPVPGMSDLNIGQLLLSPTRTFAPLVQKMFDAHFDQIHGMIHCSGGGQTKCLKYLPDELAVIKNDLFVPPIIFDLIQQSSQSTDMEMYQVFNMGHRMELYVNQEIAAEIIKISESFNIPAQIIGRVEDCEDKKLTIKSVYGTFEY